MSENKDRAKHLADAVRHKLRCVEDTSDPVYRAAYAANATILCAALAEHLRFEEGVAHGRQQSKPARRPSAETKKATVGKTKIRW